MKEEQFAKTVHENRTIVLRGWTAASAAASTMPLKHMQLQLEVTTSTILLRGQFVHAKAHLP